MKPTQFLLLIIFFPLLSFGQTMFQPGVVVNLKGDTLRGFIEYKNWENNPVEINFKTDSAAPVKKYTNKEIRYFNVWLGYADEYVQYQGAISTNDVSIHKLLTERDTSARVDTVLLKVIQKGKNLSLFMYTDKIKTRYFISRKGELP